MRRAAWGCRTVADLPEGPAPDRAADDHRRLPAGDRVDDRAGRDRRVSSVRAATARRSSRRSRQQLPHRADDVPPADGAAGPRRRRVCCLAAAAADAVAAGSGRHERTSDAGTRSRRGSRPKSSWTGDTTATPACSTCSYQHVWISALSLGHRLRVGDPARGPARALAARRHVVDQHRQRGAGGADRRRACCCWRSARSGIGYRAAP